MADAFKDMRERAASAALAGAAVDPLSETVEGETKDEPIAPEMLEGGSDNWEQEGFMFELIESQDGREIKMTPTEGGGETLSITDPEEIEFILQQREGPGAGIEEQIIE